MEESVAKKRRPKDRDGLHNRMAKWPFEKAAEEWFAGRSRMVARRTLQIDKERLVPLRKAFGGLRLEEIVVNGGRLIRSYQVRRTDSALLNNLSLARNCEAWRSARFPLTPSVLE